MSIASQIMTATPPVSVWRSEPYSLEELFRHPDAGRIWATLEAMKSNVESAVHEGAMLAIRESHNGTVHAAEAERDDCRDEIASAARGLLTAMKAGMSDDDIRARIAELSDFL